MDHTPPNGLYNLDRLAYGVSKHGVVSLSRTLAAANRTHGVDILCLCPSFTDTEMLARADENITKSPALDRMKSLMGVMTVERIGEAFVKLMDSKNGTVLAVMAGAPCFEVPDTEMARVFISLGNSKCLGLFTSVETVRTWHLALMLVIGFIIIHLILGYVGL